jgi:hypothetical protein
MDAVLGAQLRQRQVPANGLQRNPGLEIRALALSRRLHSRPSFRSGIAFHPVQFSVVTSWQGAHVDLVRFMWGKGYRALSIAKLIEGTTKADVLRLAVFLGLSMDDPPVKPGT